jgi:hypothetical protein
VISSEACGLAYAISVAFGVLVLNPLLIQSISFLLSLSLGPGNAGTGVCHAAGCNLLLTVDLLFGASDRLAEREEVVFFGDLGNSASMLSAIVINLRG